MNCYSIVLLFKENMVQSIKENQAEQHSDNAGR